MPAPRILIVDDDPQVVESVHAALEVAGYEVIIARDGSEGLIRAERDAPDVVILDMMMPRRSGLNVLERLRSGGQKGPHVIMVSANADERHREFAQGQGVAAFLRKPFEIPELLQQVAKIAPLGPVKSP